MRRFYRLFAFSLLVLAGSSARADIFRFDADPFAGTTVLTTPGRQFVGNELFIPEFSFTADQLSFNSTVFNIPTSLSFFSGFASVVPSNGADVIILRDSDPDNNPATPLNAGTAADLIAERVDRSAPGFFVYFNSVLNVNRLVFSTDLSSNLADLKIVTRFTGPTGANAIAALPFFAPANFASSPVPEPSSAALAVVGSLGLLARYRHRRSRSA